MHDVLSSRVCKNRKISLNVISLEMANPRKIEEFLVRIFHCSMFTFKHNHQTPARTPNSAA